MADYWGITSAKIKGPAGESIISLEFTDPLFDDKEVRFTIELPEDAPLDTVRDAVRKATKKHLKTHPRSVGVSAFRHK